MNFSAKSCKSCLISWKSTTTHRLGQNYATFCNKLPCFGVSMNLSAKGCKKWLNSWKSTKNHRFGQTFATFWTNYHVFAFRSTFQEKVAKSASFREKTRKTIDLAKTCNFWSKLPCLGIFMNFSERSCKKCFISWKSTRNHRFGQHYATFRTNYHVFAFRWTFKEKVGKSGPFREKARKIMDLVKTCNFSNMFLRFYHVFTFRWTLWQKVAKTASFREKARKIIHLAKTLQLFEQTAMSLHLDELFRKKWQKVPHFVKKHENHRFGQNFQLFEQTTMSWHFHELFSKKLQKVPHSVE